MKHSNLNYVKLKTFLKNLAPLSVIEMYRELIVTRRYIAARELLKKNKDLLSDSDSVVIVANGPSINQIDLAVELTATDVIVMNCFYRHPSARKLRIVAYCVGELGVGVGQFDIMRVLEIPALRYWFSTDFTSRLTPQHENVHFYMPGNDKCLSQSAGILDLSRPAPSYETTAQMSIMVAIAMGYRRIALLGFDHDFLASGKYLNHFYAMDEDSEEGRSDLYVGGADYHALIQNCERMWARYKRIEKYARARGVEIINCGDYSYLDVFRRGPLTSVLTSRTQHVESVN